MNPERSSEASTRHAYLDGGVDDIDEPLAREVAHRPREQEEARRENKRVAEEQGCRHPLQKKKKKKSQVKDRERENTQKNEQPCKANKGAHRARGREKKRRRLVTCLTMAVSRESNHHSCLHACRPLLYTRRTTYSSRSTSSDTAKTRGYRTVLHAYGIRRVLHECIIQERAVPIYSNYTTPR